jgi:hypothetical protein
MRHRVRSKEAAHFLRSCVEQVSCPENYSYIYFRVLIPSKIFIKLSLIIVIIYTKSNNIEILDLKFCSIYRYLLT